MSDLQSTQEADILILRLLREVIPWQFSKKDIHPEMSLQGELGIESLGKVALAFRLEEETGVDLSEFTGSIADIRTVKDLLVAARNLIEQSKSR